MYNVDAATLLIVIPSIAAGVSIGSLTRRRSLFVALLFAAPLVMAAGIYLVEIVRLESIGRSHGESWARLVIPFLYAGSLVFVLPSALGAAAIKRLVTRKRTKGRHRPAREGLGGVLAQTTRIGHPERRKQT
ncbi:MAG: hypothetical protein OEW21_07565 [Betaproteobacteria bacterium]|nr:hypothetical protein [Betaproteobacteria bacterium]